MGDDDARIVPGLHPVRELLASGAPIDHVAFEAGAPADTARQELRAALVDAGTQVRDLPAEQLERLASGVTHQGVVAVAPPYRYRELPSLLEGVPEGEPALLVALDGITDPRNLGSIARTAEAVGAHGLIVPSRRAAGVGPAAEKAAAGALAHLPVARVTNLVRSLRELGDSGTWSVGLDADGAADVHGCELLTEPLVLVVGAEGRGLARLTAETCDLLIALPLRGRIASLNASVAAAVALYEALRRREGSDAPSG